MRAGDGRRRRAGKGPDTATFQRRSRPGRRRREADGPVDGRRHPQRHDQRPHCRQRDRRLHRQRRPAAEALREYDRKIDRQFGPALDRNYGLKEYIRKASDEKLDWTFRGLKAVKAESIPVTKILREIYTPHGKRAAKLLRLLTG